MVSVLFDGLVSTSYAQLYVTSDADALSPDPSEAFRGQLNGLCGAAVAGSLFLVIGTHTGEVPVRVVLTDDEPPAGDWEDLVDVAFTPRTPRVGFHGWGEMFVCELPLPIATYRARWSSMGMDEGKRQDVATPQQPAPDRYELTLWPAIAAPDEIVRATSEVARCWHKDGFPR